MPKFKLKRTKQCAKCPWKTSTDPHEIPDGYCEIKHRGLASTIAEPGSLRLGGAMQAMACHHSEPGNEEHCIGWLHHQLGRGNNIGLRMMMRNCENIGEMKVYGEQHQTFEDTLPEY